MIKGHIKKNMASTSNEFTEIGQNSDVRLSELFDEGMTLLAKVEETKEALNSPSIQVDITRAMHRFELATKLVSLTGLFSANESIDEIPTECLQYLLLPALLGTLSLKLTNKPRKEVIGVAEVYFRDFLRRCKEYEIAEFQFPPTGISPEDGCVVVTEAAKMEQNKINAMIQNREQKIKRYKEQKELKEKVKNLKQAVDSEIMDESTKRDYFLTTIKVYINEGIDELSSIEAEKPILDYMDNHVKDNDLQNNSSTKHKKYPSKSLKPIIITKDEVQKAVFGLGYPSIPTLTVKEFYDQRVREGLFPGAQQHQPSSSMPQTDMASEEEKKELAEEQDDEEELQRARAMDEYKDEHRRGWGNRYNRS